MPPKKTTSTTDDEKSKARMKQIKKTSQKNMKHRIAVPGSARAEGWIFKRNAKGWNAYVKEADKKHHSDTLIYFHYLCGHPKAYFCVKGWNDQRLKVVMPLAPVRKSLYYGQDYCEREDYENNKTLKRVRVWSDFYKTRSPWHIFDEDQDHGATAECFDLDTDEEEEFKTKKKGRPNFDVEDFHNLCLDDVEENDEEEDGDTDEEGDGEDPPPDYEAELAEILDTDHPELEIPKEAQVQSCIDLAVDLILAEAEELDYRTEEEKFKHIFLGGWSQGAVAALLAALDERCPSLGGVLAITPTLHPSKVDRALLHDPKSTPFVLRVGKKDTTYPLKLLKPMVSKLTDAGYSFDVREHSIGHSLDGDEGPSCEVEEKWINEYIGHILPSGIPASS